MKSFWPQKILPVDWFTYNSRTCYDKQPYSDMRVHCGEIHLGDVTYPSVF
jgi:hypothetical protein